jgi:tetratricopeptide (TPR) repeat protein
MSAADTLSLRSKIYELLSLREKESTLEAIASADSLPAPGQRADDVTAQCLFDLGFGLEFFEENDSAAALYRRALQYPVANPNITAGAWFRLGWCSERLQDWAGAMRAYRMALECGRDWPYMLGHARLNLARILTAAEEYVQAMSLFDELSGGVPVDADGPRVMFDRARCLLRIGRTEEARVELKHLAETSANSPLGVEVSLLLAEILEVAGDSAGAVACYRNILYSPHADPNLRAAVAYRLQAIPE